MDHAFDVLSKKSLLNPRSSRFSPVLFSRSFIVWHFIFWSMIHFKTSFVKGVKSVSRLFFLSLSLLRVDVQLFQSHLLKKVSFLR